MFIKRESKSEVENLLDEFPAVGLLGPRQVGKTTLALAISSSPHLKHVYIDLENPNDRAKLVNPTAYFEQHEGKLFVLDEIHRMPELFSVLRGVIDKRRSEGFRTGQFLILGSASLELLRQSSETLAGRIAFKNLSGINARETKPTDINKLWLRGGFPDSLLSKSDEASFRWRQNFINTYLERDVPQFGPRIPAVTLRRLWTMLAHNQGEQFNTAKASVSLEVTSTTTKRYLELLEDLLLVRTLHPWSGNVGKRLVKSPKVYIRDSGVTHALLNIVSNDDLLGHPIVGSSWEGFVVENIMSALPVGASAWFYRTSAGAEIDLVIEAGIKRKYAIEIKRSVAASVSKGFYLGCADVKATHRYVVYAGDERIPGQSGITFVPLRDLMDELSAK
ncbi:MAG: ATP-binding protein [Cyclobacteriaceae bacterium]|nr:ATP-binding protein [Cyclobacteriaceae bacterium]